MTIVVNSFYTYLKKVRYREKCQQNISSHTMSMLHHSLYVNHLVILLFSMTNNFVNVILYICFFESVSKKCYRTFFV